MYIIYHICMYRCIPISIFMYLSLSYNSSKAHKRPRRGRLPDIPRTSTKQTCSRNESWTSC